MFQRRVDESALPSDEERAERRAQAAASLVNIDDAERERRRAASVVFTAATAATAVALLALHSPPLARLAIAPPLYLAYGFSESASQGL